MSKCILLIVCQRVIPGMSIMKLLWNIQGNSCHFHIILMLLYMAVRNSNTGQHYISWSAISLHMVFTHIFGYSIDFAIVMPVILLSFAGYCNQVWYLYAQICQEVSPLMSGLHFWCCFFLLHCIFSVTHFLWWLTI